MMKIWQTSILVIAAILITAPAFSQQWIAQPVGNVRWLLVVHALNSEVVWASGLMGQVARTSDGGMTWLSRPVPGVLVGLPALYAFDNQVGLVGDQLGHIYRTSNGGDTWDLVHTGPRSSFNGIHFFDALHGWATGDPEGEAYVLVETSDGGLTWNPSGNSPPAFAWNEQGISRSFDWVGTQLGMFGTNKWKIWRTTDGGAQWDSVTTLMQWTPGLVMNDDGRGLLGGRTEGLETPMVGRSSDFGQTWTWVPNPPQTSTFNTLDWIEGTEEVWASTLQTGLFQSTNGGLDWTRYNLGPSGIVTEDLGFVDAGTGWAVGSGSFGSGSVWRWYGTTDVALSPPSLRQIHVYPNPFNREVAFESPMDGGPVQISVYDLLGRCVWKQELIDREVGSTIQWHGRDVAGRPVPNGVYVYRVQSGPAEVTGRLVKVR
jgi:photosystem II stability/assembly factor-like uncharacterized protein